MTEDTHTHQDEPGAPRAQLGFDRSPTPDPVDAAIERHRAAYETLERATAAVGIAETASKQAEDEAEAARKAASVADGDAWANLIATRPASMPGAVRLLRYVSTSPDVDSVEDTQDLLRQLTASVEAAEAGKGQGGLSTGAHPLRGTVANLDGAGASLDGVSGTLGRSAHALEPDPALAVVAEFRASWAALGAAIDAAGVVGVPEVDPAIEDREGEAYERLKAVRPTTPEGFRALAGAWAMVLGGERMNEPGLQHADHAADSLIAGAGVCVPVKHIDWHNPPSGFMASPAIEPFGFVDIVEGIKLEGRRLLEIAVAEYRRRRQPRGQWQLDMRATDEGRRTARALQIETLAALAHPSLVEAVGGYRSTNAISVTLRDEDGKPLFRTDPRNEVDPAEPDLVHALIAAHRTARQKWEPLAAIAGNMRRTDPGYMEAQSEADAAGKPEIAAYEALFLAQPTTLDGVAALTEYLAATIPMVNAHVEAADGDRALTAVAAALRGLKDSVPEPGLALNVGSTALGSLADRILSTWAASAAAERVQDDAELEPLIDRRSALIREAEHLPATKPHLVAKALALAWITYSDLWEVGCLRGDYAINGRLAFDIEEIARVPAPEMRSGTGLEYDLVSLSVAQLARLYEALEPFKDLIGRAENAPCFWNGERTYRTFAGDIIYREAARLDRLLRDIAKEIERRQPEDDDERNERLRVLVRRAALLDGLTTDRALLTEALAACDG